MEPEGKQVLIIHNNDFPEQHLENLECPKEDNCFLGILARSEVKEVADHIYKTLQSIGYNDIKLYPVKSIEELANFLKEPNFDLVFNLCESLDCDSQMEVTIAKILEDSKIPFTGNSSTPLAKCLDKYSCSKQLKKSNVSVPHSILIPRNTSIDNLFFPNKLKKIILKPNSEDGSIGIEFSSVVRNESELRYQAERLIRTTNSDIIAQEYIDGREINVGIIGDNPKLWCYSEIDFSKLDSSKPKILNYSSKWCPESHEYNATKTIPPILTSEIKDKLIKEAQKTISALHIDGHARIDFRVTSNGTPYVVDVNPNCDLAPDAGFAKANLFSNVSYTQLIKNIILHTKT